MSLSVRTNTSSANAMRNMMLASQSLDARFKHLSSGLRITSAADDAAGLQISNRLTSEINGQNTAIRNANDGISVASAADGALEESVNLMQRMRVLALQAGSGVNNAAGLTALNNEFQQLKQEMDRLANATTFAGTPLLSGTFEGHFQIGAYAGQTITINDLNAKTNNLGEMGWAARSPTAFKPGAYNINDLKLSTQPITLNGVVFNKDYARVEDLIADINNASYPGNQSPVTAEYGRCSVTSKVDLSALPSFIDINGLTVDLTNGINLTGWDPSTSTPQNASVMQQVIAKINQAAGGNFSVTGSYNNDPTKNQLTITTAQGRSLKLADGTTTPSPIPGGFVNPSLVALFPEVQETTYLGAISLYSAGNKFSHIDMEGSLLNTLGFYPQDKRKYTVEVADILTPDAAQQTIRTLDAGLRQIGCQRSDMGAKSNALEARARHLSTAHEQVSASRARIRDTDMAEESTQLVRLQIMQQASQSILGQANSRPQAALSLLKN